MTAASSDSERLSLYYSPGCAYCAEVRRVSSRLGIPLELRDVRTPPHGQQLLQARKRLRVPVLRIDSDSTHTLWLPESLAIVDYLETIAARRDGRTPRTAQLRLRIWLLRLTPFVLLGISAFTSGVPKALLLVVAAALAIVRFLPPRSTDRPRRRKNELGS